MQYEVEFATSAAQELRGLELQIRKRISTKIAGLATEPIPPGARRYQGAKDHWRIRIGDYRVIYRIEKSRVVIVIVRIGHRREIYR